MNPNKIKLSYKSKMELINILQSEMDITFNPDYKARYYNLIVKMKKPMYGYDGSLKTLKVSPHTQHHINFLKRLQLVYLKNFKYNNTISSELREYLDIRIGILYKKISNSISNYKSYKKEKSLKS